jgi:hypothetical protein
MRAPTLLRLSVLCAGLIAAAAAPAQDSPFEPTGEVRILAWGTMGTSAAFDEGRIVGPTVNLTRREDGTWAGDLAGRNVALEIRDGRLTGANVNLVLTQKGDATRGEGLFFGVRFRFELDGKRLSARFGDCTVDAKRLKAPGQLRGDAACLRRGDSFPSNTRATVQLIGDAANEPPPVPQLALSLLACMAG